MKAETKSLWSSLVSAAAANAVARTNMDTAAKSMGQAIVVEVGNKPKATDLDSLFNQLIAGKPNQAERKAKSRALQLAKSQFDLVLPPEYVKASQKGKAAAEANADKKAEEKKKASNANRDLVIAAMESDKDGALTAFLVKAVETFKKGGQSVRVPTAKKAA